MEYSAMAQWLNTFFAGYDNAILSLMNKLADAAGGFLTPLMKVISFLGEKGIIMFLLALGLMCFSRTRKIGVCIFGAVCCGALITNIILKDLVARPRPFEYMAQYKNFWEAVGSPAEDGFSFPSGHVTAATAGMAALCFSRGKKWILPSVIVVLLMGISRNYLMAHFPSDVLFAVIIGLFSAYVAYLITRAIFNYLEDNDDFPLCAGILNFDLPVPDLSAISGKLTRSSRHAAAGGAGSSRRTASARVDVNADEDDFSGDNGDVSAVRSSRSEKRRAGARAGRSRAANANAGGFKAALQSAASAGSSLISKAGQKIPAARAEKDESRKSGSDWNSRWENYRNSHGPNAAAGAPEAPIYTPKAAPNPFGTAADVPAAPGRTAKPDIESFGSFDEDADMKIAQPRAKRPAADEESDVRIAQPRAAKPAAEKSAAAFDPGVSDDGIDWARLGLNFLADDDILGGTEVEIDEPVRRRSSSSDRSGRSSSGRGGVYRGRHEK